MHLLAGGAALHRCAAMRAVNAPGRRATWLSTIRLQSGSFHFGVASGCCLALQYLEVLKQEEKQRRREQRQRESKPAESPAPQNGNGASTATAQTPAALRLSYRERQVCNLNAQHLLWRSLLA